MNENLQAQLNKKQNMLSEVEKIIKRSKISVIISITLLFIELSLYILATIFIGWKITLFIFLFQLVYAAESRISKKIQNDKYALSAMQNLIKTKSEEKDVFTEN